MDSCPSDEVVGGFFFDIEAVRTASRPRRSTQVAKQKRDPMEKVPVLKEYLGLVEDQLDEPFVFAPFHEAWTEENNSPHDHLAMDTAFMEPMFGYSVPFHASRRWRLGGLFFDVEPFLTQARPQRLRPTRE